MTPPTRFSIIDYLNALPLNMAFKDGLFAGGTELLFDYPSQCADNLATGRADVGLISSIEYQRIPNLLVAPFTCIASRNEVKSVLIVTKKPLQDVAIVALDRFSRSSVALLRILLKRRYGKRPFFTTMAPEAESMLAHADAALIIGDAALQLKPGPYQVIDLASLWFEDTGLPFVFAFWAMRTDPSNARTAAIVLAAKRYGCPRIALRIADIQQRWPMSGDDILDYFHRHIHFDLGAEEEASLELFYQYAAEAELIPFPLPLRFAEPGVYP